jgi:sigma-B regulation protein RsbU (phosphoserine phosphatase)
MSNEQAVLQAVDGIVSENLPIRVLLIDDQPIIAEAIRQMLAERKDIIFKYCNDPSKALQSAIEFKPTVILQDLVMPNVDGITLVRYFKANKLTKDIPLVVLSSKEEPIIKADAFAAGATDYLVKLPDRVELIARVLHHSQSYNHLLQRNEAYQKLSESQQILTQELNDAAEYVKGLLPKKWTGSIQTDWIFIPSTQLGGDAFGYHWIDGDNLAIYLLDVCGHGVGAALLSISVANVLISQSLPNVDFKVPSQVLKGLNNNFPMEKHNNMFFTMWYGVYNKTNKNLVFANGGHPPAILFTGDKKGQMQTIELKTSGMVVGGLPDAEFVQASCVVRSLNQFYLFSDGVFELIKKNGEMMSYHELIDLLSQVPDNVSDKIKYVQDKIGNLTRDLPPYPDDFSILTIHFDV